MTLTCYQCERETPYLFADSRCCDCTRLTFEEVTGDKQQIYSGNGESKLELKTYPKSDT